MPPSSRSKDAIDSLAAIPLFAGVDREDLEVLASHLIERRFPKNTSIVEEGLPGDYMYIIRSGRVKVTKLSEEGREKIMGFLEAGDFFGEMALLDRSPRSASVKTLGEVRLLALSRRDFLDVLRKSPDVSMAVIAELSRRLREMDEQASSLSFQRVKDRARGLLGRIARDPAPIPGRRMTPPLTHQQIADMIGTSRETVTRVLKELREEGWLLREGKRYLVPETD